MATAFIVITVIINLKSLFLVHTVSGGIEKSSEFFFLCVCVKLLNNYKMKEKYTELGVRVVNNWTFATRMSNSTRQNKSSFAGYEEFRGQLRVLWFVLGKVWTERVEGEESERLMGRCWITSWEGLQCFSNQWVPTAASHKNIQERSSTLNINVFLYHNLAPFAMESTQFE